MIVFALLALCAPAAHAITESGMPAFLSEQSVGYKFQTLFAMPANLVEAIEAADDPSDELTQLEKKAQVLCGIRQHHLNDPCSKIAYKRSRRKCSLVVDVTAECAAQRAAQESSNFDATMLYLLPTETAEQKKAKREVVREARRMTREVEEL